jgi:DNA-binding IclR family transcriptional regulator
MSRGCQVLPAEMVILLAMAEAGGLGKEALRSRVVNMTDEYVGRLYRSLVRRGYLKRRGSSGYQLTSKGGEALIEFLHRNETRARRTINALERLRINIGQEKAGVKGVLMG